MELISAGSRIIGRYGFQFHIICQLKYITVLHFLSSVQHFPAIRISYNFGLVCFDSCYCFGIEMVSMFMRNQDEIRLRLLCIVSVIGYWINEYFLSCIFQQ